MDERDCIFCKIARGELDAEVVHDEDEVLAIKDINGRAPVHVLVIPRQHVASLEEVTSLPERRSSAWGRAATLSGSTTVPTRARRSSTSTSTSSAVRV